MLCLSRMLRLSQVSKQPLVHSFQRANNLSSIASAARVKHPQAVPINQTINQTTDQRIAHIEQPLYIPDDELLHLHDKDPLDNQSIKVINGRASISSTNQSNNQSSKQSINQTNTQLNNQTNTESNAELSPLFAFRRMAGPLTDEEIQCFHRDGFLIKRSFYSKEEANLMLAESLINQSLDQHRIDVPDSAGRISKMTVWNTLSEHEDDMFSLIGSGERMVKSMQQILGDEVYHYHSKLMIKEPKVGGKWEWHQDYGYWYQNGCLTPRMASGLIAITRATKANGCLQVLRGSHLLGRIEHGVVGGQTGADSEIVEALMKNQSNNQTRHCELVHVECEPGDTLLFHSNLLHCSGPNLSDEPRWSLICCYNARSNDPIRQSHHPNYHPIKLSHDKSLLQYRDRVEKQLIDRQSVEQARRDAFLDPEEDRTTPGSRKAHAN